jgi:hypothetical protein
MTNEQLDDARYIEAEKRSGPKGFGWDMGHSFDHYRELVRTEWQPTDPKTLTYDQLIPGKRYRATVVVEHVRYEAPLKLTMWTDAAYEEIPEPPAQAEGEG